MSEPIHWSKLTEAQQNLIASALADTFSQHTPCPPAHVLRLLNLASQSIIWTGERSFAIAEESKEALALIVSTYLKEG
jgi:hypothetical protein